MKVNPGRHRRDCRPPNRSDRPVSHTEDQIIATQQSSTSGATLQRAAGVVPALRALAPRYDTERSFPLESFDALLEAGLLAAPLDAALGGDDMDGRPDTRLAMLRLLKHVGRGDLSVGRLFEGHVNALQLIQIFGTESQIEDWARDVREDGKRFAVWNTQAGDGVKLVPLESGRYRMQGSKTFASGACNIERPIVTGALPDGGWQMCVVPMDEVATSIDPAWWQPPGMHASTSFKVDFTGVELDASALLGQPDDYHLQPWFFGGAIRFAAVQLGGAEALLDETRAFLRGLGRTDDPHQQARLGNAAILIEAGNLWIEGAARAVDISPDRTQRADQERIINYANMTRLAIEQICMDVMRLTERAVGARGLLRPLPNERIIRDLTLYLRQPAPDAAQTSVGRLALEREQDAYGLWHDE